MNKKTILNLKRTANQITSENDINTTNDNFLDLSRKIFVYHYGKKYEQWNFSLYQTGPYKHEKFPNLEVTPHFVRDDGVVIYLKVLQNNVIIQNVQETTVQLAMEILKLKIAKIFTIILKPDFNIENMGNTIALCYSKICEATYHYTPEIVKNYISSTSNKKRKIEDEPNGSENTEPVGDIVGFVYNDWVSASKTRNFALRDTLVDWLDYWYDKSPEKNTFEQNKHHSKNTSPKIGNIEKDTINMVTKRNENEFNFGKFIMGKGLDFEGKVINLIKNKKLKPEEFVTICKNMNKYSDRVLEYEEETIKEIMKGTPVIYQALVMNRSGKLAYSYGLPDLIVRSDYLSKIMEIDPLDKNMKNFKAPKLNGNYHYVIVDIKFTTLELCADGKRIRNSGSIPAYKCQLYIYNHALGKIQGYEPKESYILGRKFKYESKGIHYSKNDCFTRFGHIQYDKWDNDYINESIAAIKWIKKLRSQGKEWKLLPKPTVEELYPNMSSTSDTPWDAFKTEYANIIGEITLLWNCGVKNRDIAHENGVYSFMDPNCSAELVGINGPKQAPIVDEIIKINRKRKFDSVMDRVHMKINENIDNQWMESSNLRFSVDFETINCIFDDFSILPIAQDQNYLFMIGVGYKIKGKPIEYKMFLAAQLSKDAEFQMIYQFYKFLRSLTNEHLGKHIPIPSLYHWGHIERSFFEGLCAKLTKNIGPDIKSDIELMNKELDWFDLSECFKSNPIVINGCFKFGLKEIAGRLSELGLIKSKWNSNSLCTNGNTAMIMAQKVYQTSAQKNVPIIQNPNMKEIMEYNKIDCIVIHEIIDFMQSKALANGLMEIEKDDDTDEDK